MPNTSKNAKFQIFGIKICQLATQGNGITLRYRNYPIDRLGVMAQKAEKMLLKIMNEWLCNVQLFPQAWILEISTKPFRISVSGSHLKAVFGYPYPVARSPANRIVIISGRRVLRGNGFRVDSCRNRAPFVLVVVVALFMVPVFIYFFQKFPNFCGQICGLGSISVRFRLLSFYQV